MLGVIFSMLALLWTTSNHVNITFYKGKSILCQICQDLEMSAEMQA